MSTHLDVMLARASRSRKHAIDIKDAKVRALIETIADIEVGSDFSGKPITIGDCLQPVDGQGKPSKTTAAHSAAHQNFDAAIRAYMMDSLGLKLSTLLNSLQILVNSYAELHPFRKADSAEWRATFEARLAQQPNKSAGIQL